MRSIILLPLVVHATFYNLTYGPSNHTFDVVHTLEDINLFMHDMALHENATIETIGQTYESRDIYGMTIDDHPNDDSIKYHVVECTAHAREWISPAFCQLLLYELLYGNYQHMRQSAKWIFIPMLNPDGYAFSKTTTDDDLNDAGICKDDRGRDQRPCWWRKNRAPHVLPDQPTVVTYGAGKTQECWGIDLNRNNDAYFVEPDNYTDRCAETYTGLLAMDQLENQAKRDFLADKWENVDAFYSIHSAVDCIYIPYGYLDSGNYTNHWSMHEVATTMIEYMKRHELDIDQDVIDHAEQEEWLMANSSKRHRRRTTNKGYPLRVETTLCNWANDIAGGADDWAKIQGANYSFTLELGPSTNQFQPPPHLLVPWNSQWLRAIEAAYKMIAEDAQSEDLVKGLPKIKKDIETKFITRHRGKLGFLGLVGLIGFALSTYYGRKAKKYERKLTIAEERLSVVRQTMMAQHPQLKHITAAKDPTMEYQTADNWEVEVMQPYFQEQARQSQMADIKEKEEDEESMKRKSTKL